MPLKEIGGFILRSLPILLLRFYLLEVGVLEYSLEDCELEADVREYDSAEEDTCKLRGCEGVDGVALCLGMGVNSGGE